MHSVDRFGIISVRFSSSQDFELLETFSMREVWGECTTFIHRRRGMAAEEPADA